MSHKLCDTIQTESSATLPIHSPNPHLTRQQFLILQNFKIANFFQKNSISLIQFPFYSYFNILTKLDTK